MTAAVLAALIAGHLIGDWVVQTDRQAARKGWPQEVDGDVEAALEVAFNRLGLLRRFLWLRSWRANQAHVATYHAAVLAALAPVWPDGHAWPLTVLVAVSWVTHSFIDRRWPVRWLMEHTGSRPFASTSWGPLVVDQALHLSILLLTATYLLGVPT